MGPVNKKKRRREGQSAKRELEVVNPDAAGIDVGASSHYVAVPEDRDTESVREFGCFTADLYRMADWLESCRIKTVAMESTGSYWIALFQILESRGFDVKLVDTRHIKNVSGRKSDVIDCRWIQRLHSYGLLAGAFRPDDEICVLRSYVRHRENLVKSYTPHILRMQKALIQMNLQLHQVLSDITGVSGLRIIEAILAGERDPETLAKLRHGTSKCNLSDMLKALEGDWREEHLFALRQELELYKAHLEKLVECDQKIESCLQGFEARPQTTSESKKRRRTHHVLREQLHRMTGVDLTQIDGIDALTVQTVISEVGLDLTRWPTPKHFASWLGLCPNNKITGGKVQSTRTRRVVNRAAQAFRMAAQSLKQNDSALGAYFRRMRARLGPPAAITATAHKLARLFYILLRDGKAYVDPGASYYENKHRERIIKNMTKRATQLGYQLVQLPEVAPIVS
jgi:transposase